MQKRLAGCVQVIANVSSTYWWKGKIEKTEERLCLIRSEKTLYEQVEKVIKEIHPYEIPEITAVPIVAGSKEYFRWLDQELRARALSQVFRFLVGNNYKDFIVPQPSGVFRSK
jgi:periplasmic divalent cation tolerance protein